MSMLIRSGFGRGSCDDTSEILLVRSVLNLTLIGILIIKISIVLSRTKYYLLSLACTIDSFLYFHLQSQQNKRKSATNWDIRDNNQTFPSFILQSAPRLIG